MKKGNKNTKPATSGSRALYAWVIGLALPLLGACADGGSDGRGNPEVGPEPDPVPFQEIYDQGVLRYLGQYTPMLSEQVDDLVTHTFGTGDGPQCLYGAPSVCPPGMRALRTWSSSSRTAVAAGQSFARPHRRQTRCTSRLVCLIPSGLTTR